MNNKLDNMYANEVIVKATAYIRDSGRTTIVYNGEDGPMVWADTLEEAKEKFSKAIKAAFAIRNMHFLNEAIAAIESEKEEAIKKLAKVNSEFEYTEVPV